MIATSVLGKGLLLTLLCGAAATAQDAPTIADIEAMDAPFQMVESDFDPSLLDNLAPPTSPPPRVAIPPVIKKKDAWGGSQCGIARPVRMVIRTPDVWTKFWTLAVTPYSPALGGQPPVDFSKEMIVGVFMGEQPYPGPMVEMPAQKIEPLGNEQVLAVTYRNRSKMQAVFSPPFAVQPFYLKRVTLYAGRVIFREEK